MSFRDELARIIADDPRYSIDAYAFILEALNHARHQKLKGKVQDPDQIRIRIRSGRLERLAVNGPARLPTRNRVFRVMSPVKSSANPSGNWPSASMDCWRPQCSIIGAFGRLPTSARSSIT